MRIILVFIVSFSTPFISFCQQTMDTTYIGTFDQKILIRGFVANNSIEIEQSNKHYKPNNPLNVGFGFALKNTVINFRTAFGLIQFGGKERGKTSATDLQIHQYGRHLLLDLFYQKYKGYYREDNGIERYPELSIQEIGAEVSYLFNGNKFSAKAAFDQSEKQLKSVGSFIVGGGIYMYKLNLEKDLLIAAGSDHINNLQLGMNAGYAYSWVITEHWLLSGSATGGVNLGNEPELLKDGKIKFYPTVFARGSAGYRTSDWGISLLLLIHNKSVYTVPKNTINLTSLNMELSYVKHFNRLFKKRK